MVPDANIGEYLRAGGVYRDIEGDSPFEAFKSLSEKVNLPSEILPVNLYEGLCAREAVLSTAVGNGIAIPHSQQPLKKSKRSENFYLLFKKSD